MQDQFEKLVGGRVRADRLARIWSQSYPGVRISTFRDPPTREEVFRKKARRDGFTDREIDAYLEL
jgi:hypothetical protein